VRDGVERLERAVADARRRRAARPTGDTAQDFGSRFLERSRDATARSLAAIGDAARRQWPGTAAPARDRAPPVRQAAPTNMRDAIAAIQKTNDDFWARQNAAAPR